MLKLVSQSKFGFSRADLDNKPAKGTVSSKQDTKKCILCGTEGCQFFVSEINSALKGLKSNE